MKQDVREAEQAIRYLNEKIQQTSLAGLQSVFFNLIEQQTKVVMLASISPEYVFKILDPAVVPDRKAKPQRSIIAIAGTAFGGLFAMIFVLMRSRLSA
jgi:LPS O-antigen subunit length determinant protein (WzzB/FepE family)